MTHRRLWKPLSSQLPSISLPSSHFSLANKHLLHATPTTLSLNHQDQSLDHFATTPTPSIPTKQQEPRLMSGQVRAAAHPLLRRLASSTPLTPPSQIENLKAHDPFAEADEEAGDNKQSQNYVHIRIQRESHPFFA